MALELASSVDAQKVPAWTQDITISTVAVTSTDIDSKSESSDSSEEEVGARPARLDVDYDILNLLYGDMDDTMRRWRNLYHQRVRCGTNKELWSFTRAIASLAESVLGKADDPKFGGRDTRQIIRTLVTEHGLCSFLELVVSQEDFFAEYPDFVISMLDVVIAVVVQAEKHPNVLKQSREMIAALCDNAWKKHALLANNDELDQYYPMGRLGIRHQLSFMLLAMIMPVKAKTFGSEGFLRRASFVCWFYSPEIEAAASDLMYSTIVLMYAMEGNAGTAKERTSRQTNVDVKDLMELMGQDVLPTFGANGYLMRLRNTLEHPGLINETLDWAVSSMTRSVITHPEFLNELAPSGILKAALECLNRQAMEGKPGTQSDSLCNVLGMYTMIMNVGFAAPKRHHAILTALIREGSLVEIVARALRICVTEGQSKGLTYNICLDGVKALETCALWANTLSAKNPLRKVMRQGFREEWYPTLAFLRETTGRATNSKHARILNIWKKLGEDLGFEEDVQKAQYERELRKAERHCTRAACRYHKEVCPIKLRACKGCGEKYCSSTCQRKDWKEEHKLRCKRLNGNPEGEAEPAA
ncbi:unnamed protein product [Peniophora sp. CBMAI 1063]|nr:unnamed protein product [Peniophora sp. CBMAI 1063]